MDIIQRVLAELEAGSDPAVRESSAHFFKEEVRFHGLKSQAVRKIARTYGKALKNATKGEVFALCDRL